MIGNHIAHPHSTAGGIQAVLRTGYRPSIAHFGDGEHGFGVIVSGHFDRHGDWFRGLSWRQEVDYGRSVFACFLR